MEALAHGNTMWNPRCVLIVLLFSLHVDSSAQTTSPLISRTTEIVAINRDSWPGGWTS